VINNGKEKRMETSREENNKRLRKSVMGWLVLVAILGLAAQGMGVSKNTPGVLTNPKEDIFIPVSPSNSNTVNKDPIVQNALNMPLYFELNRSQTHSSVRFLSRGQGYTVFLTPKETVLALRKSSRETGVSSRASPSVSQTVLRMEFVGATAEPKIVGLEQMSGKVNYFRGNDPKRWLTNIPTYGKVQYKDIYPGIDVVFYGSEGQLEYDFIVSPGADPKAITLAFKGAENIRLDEQAT
jgi:hypothetical protein